MGSSHSVYKVDATASPGVLHENDIHNVMRIAQEQVTSRKRLAQQYPGIPLPTTCECTLIESDPSLLQQALRTRFGKQVYLKAHEITETIEVFSGVGGTDTVDEIRTSTNACIFVDNNEI